MNQRRCRDFLIAQSAAHFWLWKGMYGVAAFFTPHNLHTFFDVNFALPFLLMVTTGGLRCPLRYPLRCHFRVFLVPVCSTTTCHADSIV
jgi:hypothetical protein